MAEHTAAEQAKKLFPTMDEPEKGLKGRRPHAALPNIVLNRMEKQREGMVKGLSAPDIIDILINKEGYDVPFIINVTSDIKAKNPGKSEDEIMRLVFQKVSKSRAKEDI